MHVADREGCGAVARTVAVHVSTRRVACWPSCVRTNATAQLLSQANKHLGHRGHRRPAVCKRRLLTRRHGPAGNAVFKHHHNQSHTTHLPPRCYSKSRSASPAPEWQHCATSAADQGRGAAAAEPACMHVCACVCMFVVWWRRRGTTCQCEHCHVCASVRLRQTRMYTRTRPRLHAQTRSLFSQQ